ncbi:MAG: HPr family phosphocarrier protein [Anaerolineales bacterium]
MKAISLTVKASEGLHARPAHLFCDAASQFESGIQVKNATEGSEFVNAKSILSVLTLDTMGER